MINDIWDAVDWSILRINHKLSQTAITTTKSEATEDMVMSTKIDIIPFLKYCDGALLDQLYIMSFYDNLLVQAKCYNIFLRPSNKIARKDGIVPITLSTQQRNMTVTALYL